MNSHIDTQLAEKIVHEVKSQGVFDEFRKDSMADVDTKPAYQNLRQRVENAVKKFLAQQKWTPETNKNQLRERLRRHIADSGFLDVGVERIVDQVVNPKIGSVFQPRIEEIAYKYLGIPPPPQIKYEPPPPPLIHPLPPLPMNGGPLKVEMGNLLPTDLEQVSPDSDKATVKSELKERSPSMMDLEDKLDDDESPPFEPLVKCSSPVESEAITAQESRTEFEALSHTATSTSNRQMISADDSVSRNALDLQHLENVTQDTTASINIAELDSEKEASRSFDATAAQESQLSQVSSDSRISIASQGFSNEKVTPEMNATCADAAVNISEEAQMPKFSENSNEINDDKPNVAQLHFDIKKDEIKFEGTERKLNMLPTNSNGSNFNSDQNLDGSSTSDDTKPNKEIKVEDDEAENANVKSSFQFVAECKTEKEQPLSSQDNSIGSSLEDTSSLQFPNEEEIKTEQITTTNVLETKQKDTHPQQQSEKTESKRHSSASLRRKHHSKDKHRARSHEKDRYKSKKSHDRSKERHSRSKHASSSSSSSLKHASGATQNTKDATAKHALSTSSCSSSSTNDTKRDADKKQQEHSSNGSTSKRSERKTAAVPNDDHNESKDKIHWRKSSDDDDGQMPPSNNRSSSGAAHMHKSSATANSNANNDNNKSTTSSNKNKTKSDKTAKMADAHVQLATAVQRNNNNKVVILNDILQNPLTSFIELESSATHANHVQVVSSSRTASMKLPPAATLAADAADDLLFFEEMSGQFTARLLALEHAMDNCRRVVNSLRFDTNHTELLDDERNAEGGKRIIDYGRKSRSSPTTLANECASSLDDFEAVDIDAHARPAKRSKSACAIDCSATISNKISPTPSDISVNSKENDISESFGKNADDTSKNCTLERRNIDNNKLSQQQRYTSEDLYKPRPVLSQRSKRRGLDSLI